MPFFKSTFNILKKVDEDEVFESKWMDGNSIQLPPKVDWDYQREIKIEDVDIWEVLTELDGGKGVYAAWSPYAEFYMITTGWDTRNDFMYFKDSGRMQHYTPKMFETFYGPLAQKQVYHRAKELGIHLNLNSYWVNEDEIWLHTQPEFKNKIYLGKS